MFEWKMGADFWDFKQTFFYLFYFSLFFCKEQWTYQRSHFSFGAKLSWWAWRALNKMRIKKNYKLNCYFYKVCMHYCLNSTTQEKVKTKFPWKIRLPPFWSMYQKLFNHIRNVFASLIHTDILSFLPYRHFADVPEDPVVQQLHEVQQHQDDPEMKHKHRFTTWQQQLTRTSN